MKTKKGIVIVVCMLFVAMTFFVACDSDKTQNQLVDMYGVVKNPIADPNPYNEWDQKIEGTNYTIDSDFYDNQVFISLTNAESLNNLYYTYSVQDFEGYGVIDVQEYSGENYLRRFREWYASGVAYTDECLVHPSMFYRCLLLILDTHSKENVLRVASELRKRKDVRIADPSGILFPFSTTEEATTSSVPQWGNNKIDLAGAWEYTTGSSSIKVGILDSGVAKHVALVDNLSDTRVVYDYQGMMRSDAQNNDILESVYGTNIQSMYYQPHGTQVAGVIGAKMIGEDGIAGVCQNVTMISLNIMGVDGKESIPSATKAVKEASTLGIKILNYSAGGYTDDPNFKSAIQAFPGLFVCAAGNVDGNINEANIDEKPVYPASYDFANIISVGWSTASDEIAGASCYGATSVDLFAPGSGILTTTMSGSNTNSMYSSYIAQSGTSFSTPYVAGVAALLLSYCPTMTTAQLKASILNNVDSIPEMAGKCVSGGRLNAKKAIENFVHTHKADRYINKGATMGHEGVCIYCNETFFEGHTWTNMLPSKFKCIYCNVIARNIEICYPGLNVNIKNMLAEREDKGEDEYVIAINSSVAIMHRDGKYYLLIECDESGEPLTEIPNNIFAEGFDVKEFWGKIAA